MSERGKIVGGLIEIFCWKLAHLEPRGKDHSCIHLVRLLYLRKGLTLILLRLSIELIYSFLTEIDFSYPLLYTTHFTYNALSWKFSDLHNACLFFRITLCWCLTISRDFSSNNCLNSNSNNNCLNDNSNTLLRCVDLMQTITIIGLMNPIIIIWKVQLLYHKSLDRMSTYQRLSFNSWDPSEYTIYIYSFIEVASKVHFLPWFALPWAPISKRILVDKGKFF